MGTTTAAEYQAAQSRAICALLELLDCEQVDPLEREAIADALTALMFFLPTMRGGSASLKLLSEGLSGEQLPARTSEPPRAILCDHCWSTWLPHQLLDGEACPRCKLVL